MTMGGGITREDVGMDDIELLRRYVAHATRMHLAPDPPYQKMVFSACLRRLGCAADAEDATQQVFLAMMQCGGAIHSSVRRWLYRCSFHVSASIVRSRRNRTRHEREKGRQTKSFCGNGEAERKENVAILMQCLGKIDAAIGRCSSISCQRHDAAAIASSMGVTQQAVAKRLGRVVRFLRREMTSKGVLFSLIAAMLLTAKKVASAAVSESIKAAVTTAPSTSLASGAAGGVGTIGAMKAGAAAVLVLAAAVVTYECTGDVTRKPHLQRS